MESCLFVGTRVSRALNDKQQLVPALQTVSASVESVADVLIELCFCSGAAGTQVEHDEHGQPNGVRELAAVGHIRHGRTVTDLEQRADPPAPSPQASFTERMANRTKTSSGRARYKLRQQTIEPAFGVIEEVLGFGRFSLRGLPKMSLDWTLVTLAYNRKRLLTLGADLKTA